ncbi:MAG TPA: hypothetical protein VLH79_05030 [Chthonomonadales bacterium]|nr:hypothetical protein [Chthonomonadales bacterium]
MKRFVWLLGCLTVLALGAAQPAQAQFDDELARDWQLRLGFFVPESEQARGAVGDVWLSFGAERVMHLDERYDLSLSIEYYGRDNIYNVPVLVNLGATTHRMRYAVGAGISLGRDVHRGRTNFAYKLMVGYELTEGMNPITFDVSYRGTGTSPTLNGWSFLFGKRF